MGMFSGMVRRANSDQVKKQDSVFSWDDGGEKNYIGSVKSAFDLDNFTSSKPGDIAYVNDEQRLYYYTGIGWVKAIVGYTKVDYYDL